MKHLALIITLLACSIIQSCTHGHSLTVVNNSDLDRTDEIVEFDYSALRALAGDESFILTDKDGRQVPYQITYDGKVVFPATVSAHGRSSYQIAPGVPTPVDTVACGAFYPRREDDLAWENDRVAFRAYGPALRASGQQSYGYDVWTKSVPHPVVARRYTDHLDNGISYHEDHGDGMDVYNVGPTLGAGAAALVDSLYNIAYPYCFDSYEILDNGPLRFTVKFNHTSPSDSTVHEQRIITLDAGEYLNRTQVTIIGLNPSLGIAPGIVVHEQNPDGYKLQPDESFMAYADPTDNADAGNGTIFIGVVAPDADTLLYRPFDSPRGDAVGHLLAKSAYTPGDPYIYYWGAGWSKGPMPDWDSWTAYLSTFRSRLETPLEIILE